MKAPAVKPFSALVHAVAHVGEATSKAVGTVGRLQILWDDYATRIVDSLRRGNRNLVYLVAEPFEAALATMVNELFDEQPRRPPIVDAPIACREHIWSLDHIARGGGYRMNYVVCKFATRLSTGWRVPAAIQVDGVELRGIKFSDRMEYFRYKAKQLKTQTNWIFEVREVWIPGALFQHAKEHFSNNEAASDSFFFPQTKGHGREHAGYFPRFVCAVSGRVRFCACAREWLNETRGEIEDQIHHYASQAPARAELYELTNSEFLPDLCHLCVARRLGRAVMIDRYGTDVLNDHEVYVRQHTARGLTRSTAITEIQRQLGISRWKRETELYVVVREIFPDWVVEREARPAWLGAMRLDVFVPELKIAFEHMGEQHYRPLSVFGGEDAHRKTVERDQLKRRLCAEHGVTVIDVKPDEAITMGAIAHRVPAALRSQGR